MILIAHGFDLGFGFLNECGFEIDDRFHRYLGLTMKRTEIVGFAGAIAMGAFFQQHKSPVGF
ncbi:MAG: hypothetical protein KGZ80_01240 [Methylomonas sp.]|nr:hypothetical protein [Methylomonas sp.]